MTTKEHRDKVSRLADEVEREVAWRIDSIVSDAVREAIEDELEDEDNGTLAVKLALAFMCQTDPDNQEFSRINIDKAKMKDLLTRAEGYIKGIGDLNAPELRRRLS